MAKQSKYLVVVESPAKAKTINKYLGKEYDVRASLGHVRDLPKNSMGIKINGGFHPVYRIMPERKETVAALRKAAKTAEKIYFATDLDREGEAIAWHLCHAINVSPESVYRVIFNEITKDAIQKAFANPGRIDMNKVNAQQARRILDRVVGYELSPLLWQKIRGKLSAGRVQSVAVRLVVEREKEIQAFKPQEYWTIEGELETPDKLRFVAELVSFEGKRLIKPPTGLKTIPEEVENGDEKPESAELPVDGGVKTFWIGNQAEAEQILQTLKQHRYVVSNIESKERLSSPPPPFTTSTLQQQASVRLHFKSSMTMLLAQQLYEGVELGSEGSVALITYMRTDSVRVSEQAIAQCREVIKAQFGDKYLPDKPNIFKSKKTAQEAHEAIRPTEVQRTPAQVKEFLTEEQYKLYELIWRRFVASQMTPARYLDTKVDIVAGPGVFQAKGSQLLFDGHTILSGHGEDKLLPPLKPGQELLLVKLEPRQRFTQPPPRYTEATLIKTLEREGIGRPSTYAPIISTIQERGYVEQKQRVFYATPLGILVTEKLMKHFPDIMDVRFTAQMEEQLDRIEEEGEDWQRVLRSFYDPFQADLKKARLEMTSEKGNGAYPNVVCKQCGKPMVERWSKKGKFLGCSGYPKCNYILPLDENGTPAPPLETGEKCEKCGSPMVIRTSTRGQFLGCSAYPKCNNIKPLPSTETTTKSMESIAEPPGVAPSSPDTARQSKPNNQQSATSSASVEFKENCPLCGKPMVMRWGKRGPFLGCSGFPTCKHIKPLSTGDKPSPVETEEKCDKCGAPMVVRMSRRGKFLGCSAYPKCKNTKPLPTATEPPQETGETCDLCGKPMVVRTSAQGKFLGCSGYPKCRRIRPYIEKQEKKS